MSPTGDAGGPFGPVVSSAWLAAHLGQPDLRVVDATWYMPAAKRDAHALLRRPSLVEIVEGGAR